MVYSTGANSTKNSLEPTPTRLSECVCVCFVYYRLRLTLHKMIIQIPPQSPSSSHTTGDRERESVCVSSVCARVCVSSVWGV